MVVQPIHKLEPRLPLMAYVLPLPEDSLQIVKEEFAKNENSYLSLTELIGFIFYDADQLLEQERENICVLYFGFPIIHHSMLLVEFYTGLPEASQFCYVSSMLQRSIFRDYMKWEACEKHGFMNHTMITLMKLRLGMSDEELAERFRVETYVVNMTLRLWIPALYKHVYKGCQDLYRYPAPYNTDSFTKVLDVVEVCLETPAYTRKLRGGCHQTRRAVLGVRSDGYVCFAGDVFSEHVPVDACIQRSKFNDTTTDQDVVLTHPDLQHVVMSMGITCLQMTDEAGKMVELAADRISDYKILAAIPHEYASFACEIYKTCAALTNFMLPSDDM